MSATWVYGTGNALTLPLASYTGVTDNIFTRNTSSGRPNVTWSGNQATEYGEKNSFRAEPFHRLDLAIQFHRKKKRYERTWEIGLYNAYNRRNPFFYDISEETLANGNKKTSLKRYSLFPVLPSVSYNFKF